MDAYSIQRSQGAYIGSERSEALTAKASEISQVDEVLTEHARLLSDLSNELMRTRDTFRAVLLPEPPTSCGNEAVPSPPRSPLADAIVDQTRLVRSMLMDLRSINGRSTV